MVDEDLDELFATYLPKIIRLAEYNIDSRYRSKFDADDIAATVFRTVFRRISEGKFQFDDDDSLWKQLVTITLRRISNKVRNENAGKRSINREVGSVDEIRIALSKEPDPSEVAAFLDTIGQIGQQLDDKGLHVLELRMAGCSYSEISEKLGMADRSVGRKVKLIKEALDQICKDQDLA